MKKKIVIFILGIITGILLFFVNSFYGNPISKYFAEKNGQEYVEENYEDLDLEINDVFYSFKDGYYHLRFQDKNSEDTSFNLYYDSFGRLEGDTYNDILFNTWTRFSNELREYGKSLATKNSFGHEINLNIYDEGFGYDRLQLDQVVDFKYFPFSVEANIFGYSKEPTMEEAFEILKAAQGIMDGEDFNTVLYSIILIPEKNRRPDGEAESWENALSIYNIPGETIRTGSVEDLKIIKEEMDNSYK